MAMAGGPPGDPGAVCVLQFSRPKNTLEGHVTDMGHAWHNTVILQWPALCVCRDCVACACRLLCIGAGCEPHSLGSAIYFSDIRYLHVYSADL